jgi:hypothetical protein
MKIFLMKSNKPTKGKIVEKDYRSEGEKAADDEVDAIQEETSIAD